MPPPACGGQRTALWSWSSPSTFTQVPGIKSRLAGFVQALSPMETSRQALSYDLIQEPVCLGNPLDGDQLKTAAWADSVFAVSLSVLFSLTLTVTSALGKNRKVLAVCVELKRNEKLWICFQLKVLLLSLCPSLSRLHLAWVLACCRPQWPSLEGRSIHFSLTWSYFWGSLCSVKRRSL